MKIQDLKNREKGFTLVETVIAMAISLMAISAITSTFIASSKMAVGSFLQNKAAMEARSVIDRLTSDARMAVTIESSFGSYTASPTTLILRLPAIDASGLPTDITNNFDRVIYHRDSKNNMNLLRTVAAHASSSRRSGSEVVGTSVSPGIYATQPDPTGQYVIYYRFASLQQHGSKTVEIPAAGSIQLRNHS